MFGMRRRTIAGAVEERTANYGPESAAWSPLGTDGLAFLGFPADANQADTPNMHNSDAHAVVMVRPPDPAINGEPGIRNGLGWSTGLRPTRALRTKLDGTTLVVPSMGVHPADGPVGQTTRSDRLAAGVDALVNQWLPSQQQINENFVGTPRNRNPLDAD